MKTKSIRQNITIAAEPKDVFNALFDSRKHAKFTGAVAKISKKEGGKFMAYDGYCSGSNLEIIPDELIVQTWRARDWEQGHFSKVKFAFSKTNNGTKLIFTQTGVPEKHFHAIKQGWVDYYWNPLKKYFSE